MELVQFEKKYIKYNDLKYKVYSCIAKDFSNNINVVRKLKYAIDSVCQSKIYDANLADILKPSENSHSLILKKILSYKRNGVNIFVKSLFSELFKYEILFDYSDISVFTEKYRIDLLIKDKRSAIIIENKIHNAIDQEEQLRRYIDIIKHIGISEENIFIIYLTGTDKKIYPSESLSKYNNLFKERTVVASFSTDILSWLVECVSPNVRNEDNSFQYFISQYTEHLKNFFKRDDPMSMKINDFIMAELKLNNDTPDFNVTAILDEIKNVTEVQNYLNKLLSEQKEQSFDHWYRQLITDYPSLNIIRNSKKGSLTKIGVLFEIDGHQFSVLIEKDINTIYLGISRHFTDDEVYSDYVRELSEKISDTGYKESEAWWYAWHYTSYESGYSELCYLINKTVAYIDSAKK